MYKAGICVRCHFGKVWVLVVVCFFQYIGSTGTKDCKEILSSGSKGSWWIDRWCSVLSSQARLEMKTKLLLSQPWLGYSPWLLALFMLPFPENPSFPLFTRSVGPCCLLVANSFFLLCHFCLFLFGESCLWDQLCALGFWEMQSLKCLLIDALLRQITVLPCCYGSVQMLSRSHEKNSFAWLLLQSRSVH